MNKVVLEFIRMVALRSLPTTKATASLLRMSPSLRLSDWWVTQPRTKLP